MFGLLESGGAWPLRTGEENTSSGGLFAEPVGDGFWEACVGLPL